MALQSLLMKLGCRSQTLGVSSNLAVAFPIAEGDGSITAATASNRIGWYADRTPGAEKVGHVVMGTEVLTVGVAKVTAAVPLATPASATTGSGLNIGQGTAPTSPVNGDVWVTSTGMFVQVNGATVGPLAAGGGGTIGGSIANHQVAVGNGTNTISGTGGLTLNGNLFQNSSSAGNALLGANAVTGSSGIIDFQVNSVQQYQLLGSATAFTMTDMVNSFNPLVYTAGTTSTSLFQAASRFRFSAANTARASINIPAGTAPTSPLDGDMWTTTAGVFAQISGSTVGPFAAAGSGITGTLVSGRVPFANGTSSLTDAAAMTFSTAHGFSVNRAIAGGARNEFFGLDAGNASATGTDNLAFGNLAMASISSGVKNVAIGTQALTADDAGSNNVAIGFQALMNGSGGGHVFNVAIGQSALTNNGSSNNTGIGNKVMSLGLISGSHNVGIGDSALANLTGGAQNTAVGDSALGNFQGVSSQVAIGYQAMQGSGTPASNTGVQNTAVGYQSLTVMTSAGQCTAVGYQACVAVTSAGSVTAMGYLAMSGVTTGVSNTGIGASVGLHVQTSSLNTLLGAGSGQLMADGGSNTGVGANALRGSATFANNTGSGNTAVGVNALELFTSGTDNVAIGRAAGINISTGINNTLLGANTGASLTTGSTNILIGNNTDCPAATSNTMVVGGASTFIGSVYIGNGITASVPVDLFISATGGSGANVGGANHIIAGGIGTGTGAGGAIVFQTSSVGTTGSSANSLINRLTIGGDGGVKWTGIATASAPATSGANNGTIYYDSTLQQFMASTNNGAYAALGGGGGGTIGGTAASARVAFGSGSNTITSDAGFTWQTSAGLLVQNTATSSGTQGTFNVVPPATTGITTTAENTSVLFNLTNTRTWATGTVVMQREVRFTAPTYAFVGASTITTAATVSITGAPIAGTNASITNPIALYIENGALRMDSSSTTALNLTAGGAVIQGPCQINGLLHCPDNSTIGAWSTGASVGINLGGAGNGSTAASGQVGEVLSGSNNQNPGSSGTSFNILSLSLTAGSWLIFSSANFTSGTTGFTSASTISLSLSAVTGTLSGNLNPAASNDPLVRQTINALVANGQFQLSNSPRLLNLSVTTTYFLVANVTYAGGTPTVTGQYTAVRIR